MLVLTLDLEYGSEKAIRLGTTRPDHYPIIFLGRAHADPGVAMWATKLTDSDANPVFKHGTNLLQQKIFIRQ